MYQALGSMLKTHQKRGYGPYIQKSLQLLIHTDLLIIFNKKEKGYIQKLLTCELKF